VRVWGYLNSWAGWFLLFDYWIAWKYLWAGQPLCWPGVDRYRGRIGLVGLLIFDNYLRNGVRRSRRILAGGYNKFWCDRSIDFEGIELAGGLCGHAANFYFYFWVTEKVNSENVSVVDIRFWVNEEEWKRKFGITLVTFLGLCPREI